MSDFTTTLGLNDDGFDKGLSAAIKKEERYAREVKRINKALGDDAAREFDRVTRKYREAESGQTRFAMGARKTGLGAAASWRAMGAAAGVAGVAIAGVALAGKASIEAANRYGERWDFARQKTVGMRRELDLLSNSFDRLISPPANTLFSERFLERQRSRLDVLGRFFGQGDRELQEFRERSRIEAETVASIRANELQRSGRPGAAGLIRAGLEGNKRLREIRGDEKLTPAQRSMMIGETVNSFIEQRRVMQNADAISLRSAALRRRAMGGGFSVSERFGAQRAGMEAERLDRIRGAFTAPGTPQERKANAEAINTAYAAQLDQLERQERVATRMLTIERERAKLTEREAGRPTRATRMAAIGLEYQDALARSETIDDPAARAIARDMARARLRERGMTANREFDDRRREIGFAIEDYDLERMDRFGQTNAAERIRAQRNFENQRRSAERSLGTTEAAPLIAKLEKQLAETIARIGIRQGRTLAVGDPRLGGFEGIRRRMGVSPETRYLEEIARNTAGYVALRVR